MQTAYVKFEIYLPTRYRRKGEEQWRSVSYEQIRSLANDFSKRFGGCTYSNPVAPAPCQGIWQDKGGIVEVDNIFQITVLVEEDPSNWPEVMRFFEDRKSGLEQKYCQDIVLVTFYPVYVVGQL